MKREEDRDIRERERQKETDIDIPVAPEPVLTPLSANLLLLPASCQELDLLDNS